MSLFSSKVNRSLEEIHLAKCGIRDFGAERLAENLAYNTTLKHLDLSWYVVLRAGSAHKQDINIVQILHLS
jgi:Ran GTPase-activating protein (RanGAP) involved in mRNA processing and transport